MKGRQKKVYPASRAYEESLDERLKDPEYAIAPRIWDVFDRAGEFDAVEFSQSVAYEKQDGEE